MMTRFILGLCFAVLCACSQPTPDAGQLQLADAPERDGRWVVLNYWATWCAPCREEIPELNELAHVNQKKVAVYGINFDGAIGEELIAQSEELGIEFVQLRTDPAGALSYPRPTVLPTTLVLDPQGDIKARLIGPQTVASLLEVIHAE